MRGGDATWLPFRYDDAPRPARNEVTVRSITGRRRRASKDWSIASGRSGRLVVAPEPAERVGQDRAAVLAVVAPVAGDELVVVLGKLQRRRHLLVGEEPVAERIVQIVRPVLQKYSDRLGRLSLADQRRVVMAAADVGEAADVAEHLAKCVGP